MAPCWKGLGANFGFSLKSAKYLLWAERRALRKDLSSMPGEIVPKGAPTVAKSRQVREEAPVHCPGSNRTSVSQLSKISGGARSAPSGDKRGLEDGDMSTSGKRSVGLFVDRAHPHHWIVRDAHGDFWIV